MSILYGGQIRSMPPKLLTDDKRNVVIRPLAYCQEKDIIRYAAAVDFPIIPCNLCGTQENLTRQRVKQMIADLADHNPKVPSNMLSALNNIQPSQLMDRGLWDFTDLEKGRSINTETPDEIAEIADTASTNESAFGAPLIKDDEALVEISAEQIKARPVPRPDQSDTKLDS